MALKAKRSKKEHSARRTVVHKFSFIQYPFSDEDYETWIFDNVRIGPDDAAIQIEYALAILESDGFNLVTDNCAQQLANLIPLLLNREFLAVDINRLRILTNTIELEEVDEDHGQAEAVSFLRRALWTLRPRLA